MRSGLGRSESGDALLVVGDSRLADGSGTLTGILANGAVSPAILADVLGRLRTAGIAVELAGVGDETLVVAVERRDGPDALRVVEGAVGR